MTILEQTTASLHPDSLESARSIGLRYVSDQQPGIKRERVGDNFRYFDPKGREITDEGELQRIRSLAIPPAYSDVWICTRPNGHLQATGRDAKGRKQYRYHPKWRTVRDETKYERTILFAEALPNIRARVDADLGLKGLPRAKVLATVVRLLETTLIRVGNQEYAKQNNSYGLTTMRDKHVDIDGATVQFHFRGKSGVDHSIELHDRRVARIVKQCRDLPGYELFQYIDEAGERQTIDSADVNDYLREISGQDFTAKDFRTWAGTVLAAMALQSLDTVETQTQAKKQIVAAVEQVAEQLGNTPSVCRKCYIHPVILDAYLDGSLIDTLQQRVEDLAESDLNPNEALVLGFLRKRLETTP